MDKARLEYEIKKRGLKVGDFCKAVQISKSAYYRKCRGRSEFTQREIQRIVDYLGLATPVGVFFTDNVS